MPNQDTRSANTEYDSPPELDLSLVLADICIREQPDCWANLIYPDMNKFQAIGLK